MLLGFRSDVLNTFTGTRFKMDRYADTKDLTWQLKLLVNHYNCNHQVFTFITEYFYKPYRLS